MARIVGSSTNCNFFADFFIPNLVDVNHEAFHENYGIVGNVA